MFYDFAAIKAAHSFADIIDQLGLELKQSGNQWRGECPFCKTGGDRALVITEGKGYYCHAAKKGGDQLALYAHIRDISVKDAAAELAEPTSTVKVPSTPTSTSTSSQESRQADKPDIRFDRAKYQASLNRDHELLKDVPTELVARADLGVSSKGAHRGLISVPLYDKDTGAFLCYVGVPSVQFPRLQNVVKLKAG